MSNVEMETQHCKLSMEQKLLITQTRLALEADFRVSQTNVRKKIQLWEQIRQQLTEKDSNMNGLTIREIQYFYQNSYAAYRRMKATGEVNETWERVIFDMFETAFADNQSASNNSNSALRNELYQLVLNARLSRESEFKNSDQNKRHLLWKKILEEIKAKVVGCSKDMTIRRIQGIFSHILQTYKRKKANKRKSCWPYFEQMDKIYGQDDNKLRSISHGELKQLVLNARLCREAKFKKFEKNSYDRELLWQEILEEVKAKAVGCTEVITIHQIQQIFAKMLLTYKKQTNEKNRSYWPYFDQMHKVYGNEDIISKWKKQSIEFSKLKHMVLNARLSREAEFQKYSTTNTLERKKLWDEIFIEVAAKAAGCCTMEINKKKVRKVFTNLYYSYREHKRKKTGSSWPYFDQMDKIYGHDDKKLKPRKASNFNDELKQLVLNARLCREAKFQKCTEKSIDRKLLWQEVFCEVKDKAVGCTEHITKRQIQLIYFNMLHTYKKQTNQKRRSYWPYFDQMNKVYGNDDIELKFKKGSNELNKLKQMVLNARLSREAEFQKYSTSNTFERKKLWEEIFIEIKAKAAEFCTLELNSVKIQKIFNDLLCSYKKQKNIGNRSWKYFEQMDRVYGNCETFEIFTTDNDNDDVECKDDSITFTGSTLSALAIRPTTEEMMKFLKQKAFNDREIFQQICDIEKHKIQLQRAEIDELQKLVIFYENKRKQIK